MTGWIITKGIPMLVVSSAKMGAAFIEGLKDGIQGQMNSIGSWIKSHIVDPIISAVKNFFGIHSPSRVFEGIGGNLIRGLAKGLIGGNPRALIGKVFGGMPQALGALFSKGLIGLQGLGRRALDALGFGVPGGISADFLGSIKGFGGAGVSGILAIARALGNGFNAHTDPQGGSAFDIFASGAANARLGEALRLAHNLLGLRYVITNMMIASARSAWNWRPYTPIASTGDFRHENHTHVSYDSGGWLPPGHTMTYNGTRHNELILTKAQQDKLFGRAGGDRNFYIQAREIPVERAIIEAQQRADLLERIGA
jgi:hypothetical protein